MKKILVLLLLPVFICGCSFNNRNDIENTTLIRIFGVDKTENGFEVTILYDASLSMEEKNFQVISAEGSTVFEAYEKIKQKCDKQTSLSQTKFFLIGKSASEFNIEQSIDFVARHQSIKMDSMILTLNDRAAKSVLEKAKDSKIFLGDTLKNMQKKESKVIEHENNTIAKIIECITQKQKTIIIPNLKIDKESPYIDCYNIFVDLKMSDSLDPKTSMGVDLVCGNVKASPVYIENALGLIITNMDSKREIAVSDGKIKVTIKTNFISAIREVVTDDSKWKNKTIEQYSEIQNQYIDNLIKNAIEYGAKTGYDILGIEELLRKDEGKDVEIDYNNIDFVLKTDSIISNTFDIERM